MKRKIRTTSGPVITFGEVGQIIPRGVGETPSAATRILELEAQCAAMRAALEAFQAWDKSELPGFDPEQLKLELRWHALRDAALSHGAGREFEARIRQGERERCAKALDDLDGKGGLGAEMIRSLK